MAIAFVQKATHKVATGVSSITSNSLTTTAGNSLFAAFSGGFSSAATLNTSTDSKSNTWVKDKEQNLGGGSTLSVGIQSCVAPASVGSSHTVSCSSTGSVNGDWGCSFAEFSGVKNAAVNATNGGTNSDAAATPGSVSPTGDCLYFGAVNFGGADTTITEDSPSILITEGETGSSAQPLSFYYQIGSGAKTMSATLGAARTWLAAACAYQAKTIAFDAASNSGYKTATTPYTWSHTCTGPNRFLAVDITIFADPTTTVTALTYNSVAMTLLGFKRTGLDVARVECWGLVNPASGTNTISVTLSSAMDSIGTAVSYTDVHQTTPTEGFASAEGTNGGSPADATVNVTTVADNDWVHAVCGSDDTAITANQTSRNNVTGSQGSGANEDTGPKTPAGSQTMSYTGIAAVKTWVIAAYGLRPSDAPDPAADYLPMDLMHMPKIQPMLAM